MADTTPSQDPLRLAEALERMRPEFCGNQATLLEAAALIREQHAALAAPQPNAALADEGDAAYREARTLATALFKKHFAHGQEYASGEVVWGVCDTTAGIISQIDNMVSGLVQPADAAALADGWMPIETAPKDGVELWVFNGEQGVMHWTEGAMPGVGHWALWVWADQTVADIDPEPIQPTHWRPLPAPPTLNASKGRNDG